MIWICEPREKVSQKGRALPYGGIELLALFNGRSNWLSGFRTLASSLSKHTPAV